MAYDKISVAYTRVWDKITQQMITIQVVLEMDKKIIIDELAQKAYNNINGGKFAKALNGGIQLTYVPSIPPTKPNRLKVIKEKTK
jgi:hypothetical protein